MALSAPQIAELKDILLRPGISDVTKDGLIVFVEKQVGGDDQIKRCARVRALLALL